MDRVRAFVAKVEPFLARLFKRYVPSIATIPGDDVGTNVEGAAYSPSH